MITSDDVREYKITRGDTFEERVNDIEEKVRRHFTFDSLTEQDNNLDGNATVYKAEPENAGLHALFVGMLSFDSDKKTRFILGFDEVEPKTLDKDDMGDLSELLEAKNELLREVTGYTAKQRRDKMRRDAKD